MSITISFTNDKDQSVSETYDCIYCDPYKISPTCKECKGTGKKTFVYSRFEMNLANGNFSTFWNALGLDTEGFSCDPSVILTLLKQFNTELAIRATVEDGNSIDCGLNKRQIDSYVSRLTLIAEEAQKRKELITWG